MTFFGSRYRSRCRCCDRRGAEFCHTLGEFGVVLMVGGNIEGETRTVSIDIHDEVQALNYAGAAKTSLLLVYAMNRKVWMVHVTIDCRFPLITMITRGAVEDLRLSPGVSVIAAIKAGAVHLVPRSVG